MYEVSSEIYSETDYKSIKVENGRVISKFPFSYAKRKTEKNEISVDNDGDLIVTRKNVSLIEIEHSASTILQLVGLQVWRGALLLADFIFHNHEYFADKFLLELGGGVGLTSIAAGIYCKNVVCTDINIGGILEIINGNIKRNRSLLQNDIKVLELDFKTQTLSKEVGEVIDKMDIIIAADVIYDDDLTDGFINIIELLLNKSQQKSKIIFVALEKRYVFTVADLDTTAPCFEYFLKRIHSKPFQLSFIPLDFPQYFTYERCKELILMKIVNK